MNIRSILIPALCTIIAGTCLYCTSKKKKETPVSKQPVVNFQTASQNEPAAPVKGVVCIWDGLGLRESPIRNSRQLATINLGEMVKDLDSSSIDFSDKKREYFKVRLSDGKTGWSPSFGLKKEAIPAVFRTNASLYKRPDHLTITEIRFIPMEFVIIMNTNDDWYEIIGDQGRKNGWIKKDAVSTNKEDITTAILITKKMASKDSTPAIDKMKSLIENAPYPSSEFISVLRQKVEAESSAIAQKNIVEAISPDTASASIDTSVIQSDTSSF